MKNLNIKFLATSIVCIMLACFTVAHAQFKTGIVKHKASGFSGKYISIAGLDWMQQDISLSLKDTTLQGMANPFYIPREQLNKYILPGWRLPTQAEVRSMIAALEGEKNTTGGKTADSIYLQNVFPFKLDGIYYPANKRMVGVGYMTAYYTATDTARVTDTAGTKGNTQVAIHVYLAGKGKMNIEPTFSRQPIYCKLRLVRKHED